MTIHSKFWSERKLERVAIHSRFGSVWPQRDSNRQRSYNCEFKHLRPISGVFKDRGAAKGYARLCAKIAIRRMVETGLIKDDATRDRVRASFTAAFTKETIGRCDANNSGAYFAKWGWTDCIIAHEVAHWADHWAHLLSKPQPFIKAYWEGHGPRWRGWFTYILAAASDRYTLDGIKQAWATERLQITMP